MSWTKFFEVNSVHKDVISETDLQSWQIPKMLFLLNIAYLFFHNWISLLVGIQNMHLLETKNNKLSSKIWDNFNTKWYFNLQEGRKSLDLKKDAVFIDTALTEVLESLQMKIQHLFLLCWLHCTSISATALSAWGFSQPCYSTHSISFLL